MVTRRYFVSGRVQGVGFRWFVEKEANGLGLSGWTRNISDGRVEVLASGTQAQQEALLARLHVGPRSSEVRGVEVNEEAPTKVAGFSIR
jgi:acylphosphatase